MASNTFEDAPNSVLLKLEIEEDDQRIVGQLVELIDSILWLLAVRAKVRFTTHTGTYQKRAGETYGLGFTDTEYTDVEGIVEGLKSPLLDQIEAIRAMVETNRQSDPQNRKHKKPDLAATEALQEIYALGHVTGGVRASGAGFKAPADELVRIGMGDLDTLFHVSKSGRRWPSRYIHTLWKAHELAARALGLENLVARQQAAAEAAGLKLP